MGKWLARKCSNMLKKREEAEKLLGDMAVDERTLRQEWEKQVAHQTRPLRRQDKQLGERAVADILRLIKARDSLLRQISDFEKKISNLTTPLHEVEDAEDELPKLRASLSQYQSDIAVRKAKLGVNNLKVLNRQIKNPFFVARLKALALKSRIRERLRQRQFELHPLQRDSRRKALDKSAVEQTSRSVSKREPATLALVRKLNSLIEEMTKLVRTGKAPARCKVPEKISPVGLFQLDIDDPIWRDAGLIDDHDDEPLPLWLGNQEVIDGINGLLLQDRCDEERLRLLHEASALRDWFSSEWQSLTLSLEQHNENLPIMYQLELHKKRLLELCVLWKRDLSGTLLEDNDYIWGPSDLDLANAKVRHLHEIVLEVEEDWGDDLSESEDDFENNGDDEDTLELAIEDTL
ncbi:hypothetical protein ONZ45_g17857 [Pleurotus djamor]|nr:hypothetical protein ONZ45_g17857 [Pleurotus djamor]